MPTAIRFPLCAPTAYTVLAALVMFGSTATAQTNKQEGFVPQSLPVTRLSIFDNGTFYCRQQGEVAVQNGSAYLSLGYPQILKGTLWFSAEKGARINQVKVGNDTFKLKKQAFSIPQLLKLNVNKLVTLYVTQGEDVVPYTGLLQPASTGFDVSGTWNLYRLALADGKGVMFLSADKVNHFILPKDAVTTHLVDTLVNTARLQLQGAGSKTQVQMVSLQQGMQWHPSYLMQLGKDGNASLQMKATIINNVEPIQNVEVDLVVGKPEMAFGTALDPVSGDQYVGAGDVVVYEGSPQLRNNKAFAAVAPQADATVVQVEGETKADLYFYRTGKVSIPKADVSIIPVQTQTVEYKDVFEAELNDHVNYYYNRFSVGVDQTQNPFRKLVFTNKGKAPLTPAPMLVLDDREEPVCQTRVPYVPAGGEAKVVLSQAQDVEVRNTEEEVDQVQNSKKQVERVTIKGKLKVSNRQDKPLTLRLIKHVTGELQTLTDQGIAKKSGRYVARNAVSKAEWTLPLKAGETREVSYDYKVNLMP